MPKPERIEAIDFWRGFALLIVFVDHLPGNPLATITPGNFGFSDAAEAFIFLSGMAVACAYWSKFAAGETAHVSLRCLRRAFQIYGAQLAISAAFIVIFGGFYLLTGDHGIGSEDGRDLFFSNPSAGLIGLATLGFQFGYANILPLYIALLVMAPLLLMLLRRSIWLGLAVSFSLYLAAQAGLQLPSWPWPDSWFFNPFAWQFMFTLGMVAAILMRHTRLPRSKLLLIVAASVVLVALAVETDGFGWLPGLSDSDYLFGIDKPLLGIGRICHFLALAYILVALNVAGLFLKWPRAREISRLGRHGLTIFSAGSMLCAIGQSIIDLCYWVDSDLFFAIVSSLVVTLGMALLFLLARWMDQPRPPRRAETLPSPIPGGLSSLSRVS